MLLWFSFMRIALACKKAFIDCMWSLGGGGFKGCCNSTKSEATQSFAEFLCFYFQSNLLNGVPTYRDLPASAFWIKGVGYHSWLQDQKNVLYLLEPKLQMGVNCHVSARNWTGFSVISTSAVNCWAISTAQHLKTFKRTLSVVSVYTYLNMFNQCFFKHCLILNLFIKWDLYKNPNINRELQIK